MGTRSDTTVATLYWQPLSLAVTFIRRVLEGVTKDIARKAGKEHRGTGTGERGRAKGKGRGKERRARMPRSGPHLLYNYLYKSKRSFRTQPYEYRRLS